MNELTHYGVLGMKWGIRKDDSSNSKSNSNKMNVLKKTAIYGTILGGLFFGAKQLSNPSVQKQLKDWGKNAYFFGKEKQLNLKQLFEKQFVQIKVNQLSKGQNALVQSGIKNIANLALGSKQFEERMRLKVIKALSKF